jgi:hypothetical protein
MPNAAANGGGSSASSASPGGGFPPAPRAVCTQRVQVGFTQPPSTTRCNVYDAPYIRRCCAAVTRFTHALRRPRVVKSVPTALGDRTLLPCPRGGGVGGGGAGGDGRGWEGGGLSRSRFRRRVDRLLCGALLHVACPRFRRLDGGAQPVHFFPARAKGETPGVSAAIQARRLAGPGEPVSSVARFAGRVDPVAPSKTQSVTAGRRLLPGLAALNLAANRKTALKDSTPRAQRHPASSYRHPAID